LGELAGTTGPDGIRQHSQSREALAIRRGACRSHGELANRILGQGTTVKTEKLSY
jgi:hypothetical protein